mgnify:CR=1 FL=1
MPEKQALFTADHVPWTSTCLQHPFPSLKISESETFCSCLTNLNILFLFQNEREAFEVVVEGGKLMYRKSGVLVNTTEDSKWIFVLSTTRSLYVGQVIIGM